MTKIGIELGIRAPHDAILQASKLADMHQIDYLFVPETHPESFGVDAFKTISEIVNDTKNITVGTGIVNIFSRDKKEILKLASEIFESSNGKFILGLGTSAPVIVEKLWKVKFEKPVSRLVEYTDYIKSQFQGTIFWAAVGNRTTKLTAKHADGVIFFLKPKSQISSFIKIIQEELENTGKENFETVAIFPIYFSETESAKITLAGYIGANEFYGNSLIKEGFDDEVSDIKHAYAKFGLKEAAKKVSESLVNGLAITGTLEETREKILKIKQSTKLDTIILGFDLPEEKYGDEFFEKLDKLLGMLK